MEIGFSSVSSVETASGQLKQVCAGNEELCELVRELLSAGAYEPWIQVFIVSQVAVGFLFSCMLTFLLPV